jgi:DNA-binding transcriptional LysR family regulator
MRGPFFVTLTMPPGRFVTKSQEETGRLHLGFIGGYLDVKLCPIDPKVPERLPGEPGGSGRTCDRLGQVRAIQAGELDGGFIGTQPLKPIKGLAFADWGQDPLLIALPEEHSLARIAKLRWQHLQGLSWVMISRQEAPAFRDLFSKITESHALAVQIVQESNTYQAVLILVACRHRSLHGCLNR